MDEEITICVCKEGGYDLCPHCLGSGIIIKHNIFDEYINIKKAASDFLIKGNSSILKDLPKNALKKINIYRKIKDYQNQDAKDVNNLLNSRRKKDKKKIITRLEKRLTEWKKNIDIVKDNDLKKIINDHIILLGERINMVQRTLV
ncbi:MAG: hypothetical protein EAZ35_09515 [Sphingobacteriia bacterium]|nr:MAG: hypothetical protein EAZ41_04695 [Sphingobacteriia bacterium]TAG29851.1 MAG: hypothetical protein EAZ35_09515 [Sphingobacteriia bacterium]